VLLQPLLLLVLKEAAAAMMMLIILLDSSVMLAGAVAGGGRAPASTGALLSPPAGFIHHSRDHDNNQHKHNYADEDEDDKAGQSIIFASTNTEIGFSAWTIKQGEQQGDKQIYKVKPTSKTFMARNRKVPCPGHQSVKAGDSGGL
jgi:hypothetical protein